MTLPDDDLLTVPHGSDDSSASAAAGGGGTPPATVVKVRLRVEGMMCQKNCGSTVERALRNVPGVVDAAASFSGSYPTVVVDPSDPFWEGEADVAARAGGLAVEEAEDVGFDCRIFAAGDDEDQARVDAAYEEETERRERERRSLLEAEERTAAVPPPGSAILEVGGMSCAVCVGRVERLLTASEGVSSATVTLATGRAKIGFDPTTTEDYRATARRCAEVATAEGYASEVVTVHYDDDKNNNAGGGGGISLRDNAARMESARNAELRSWRNDFSASLVFTVPIMIIHYGTRSSSSSSDSQPDWREWTTLCLATPAQFGVGRRFYKSAFAAARHRVLGMDALVVLGTSAAYGYSLIVFGGELFSSNDVDATKHDADSASPTMRPTFETGAMLLMFVTFGKYLEAYARGRTASAL